MYYTVYLQYAGGKPYVSMLAQFIVVCEYIVSLLFCGKEDSSCFAKRVSFRWSTLLYRFRAY